MQPPKTLNPCWTDAQNPPALQFASSNFNPGATLLLTGYKIHRQKGANNLDVRPGMKIQFLGCEGAATSQCKWEQELICKMLSRDRARHEIGARRVGGLGRYALGARAYPPKTAEHFGHIAACKFD